MRALARGLDRLARGVRWREWWLPKVAPLLAVAYLQIAVHSVAPVTAYPILAALLIALAALAAFGHVVNDAFDVRADRDAGKPNAMASLTIARRGMVAGLLGMAGVVPWVVTPLAQGARWAWAAIYVLLVIYSAPPIRMKERGVGGLVTDAAMAQAAPAFFVCLLFAEPGTLAGRTPWLILAVVTWAGLAGLRSILLGQIWDHANDIRSGVHTFTTGAGTDRARWLARRVVFPWELLALAAVFGTAAVAVPWLALVGAVALILDVWVVRVAWSTPYDPAPHPGYPVALHNVYQVWLPILLGIALAAADWRFAGLPALYLVFCHRDLREQTILRGGGTLMAWLAAPIRDVLGPRRGRGLAALRGTWWGCGRRP